MKGSPEIVYQDDTLLAVCKPSGLLSVPDRYDPGIPSAYSIILRSFSTARPLHRLDVQTSGILLFCLDPEAFGFYSDQFTERTVVKRYVALVEGRPAIEEGRIDLPLHTDAGGKVTVSKRGKPSTSFYRIKEAFRHHSLLELQPMSGRTHQLRVHLAAIGHPIVGDVTYGGSAGLFLSDLKGKRNYKLAADQESERPLIGRTALHAQALTIRSLSSGESLRVECPLPKDLAVGLDKLRRYQPEQP